MAKFLSITFDDGLLNGAVKALRLLDSLHLPACFYLVTNWVGSDGKQIRDRYNANCDHGTWDEWRRIQRCGHDIGSHSASHMSALCWQARLMPWRLRRDLQHSLDVLSHEMGAPPISIAMPYGHTTPHSDTMVRRMYRACRLNSGRPVYHDLSSLDWWRIVGWGPGSHLTAADLCRSIDETPDNHWLILNFHSLDDEGWMPVSSAAFKEFARFLASRRDLQVVTPAEMVRQWQ